jgi:predicted lipoprotein with Yx(FWY)xxD motif
MTHARKTLVLIALMAVAALASFAVACGDDDDDGDENGGAATVAPTRAATQAAASTPTSAATEPAATVRTFVSGSLGTVLANEDGMTLYTFDNDTPGSGTSACGAGCADTWPPLTIATGEPTAGDGVTGELGTITRDDGSTQVTYDGSPLYTFSGDSAPGDTNGDGLGGVWHAATP